MLKARLLIEIYLLAGLGAALALFVDFLIASDGSVLHNFSAVVDPFVVRIVPVWASLYLSALSLILLGTISVLYFKPLSLKGSFASGFSAIAVIAIFLP